MSATLQGCESQKPQASVILSPPVSDTCQAQMAISSSAVSLVPTFMESFQPTIAGDWGLAHTPSEGFAFHRTGGEERLQPFFSLGNKKLRLVSNRSESTRVTGVFEVRPVLDGLRAGRGPMSAATAGSVCLSENRLLFSAQEGCIVSSPSSESSAKPQSRCDAASASESLAQAGAAELSCTS